LTVVGSTAGTVIVVVDDVLGGGAVSQALTVMATIGMTTAARSD
jgi:hypothetical protein